MKTDALVNALKETLAEIGQQTLESAKNIPCMKECNEEEHHPDCPFKKYRNEVVDAIGDWQRTVLRGFFNLSTQTQDYSSEKE